MRQVPVNGPVLPPPPCNVLLTQEQHHWKTTRVKDCQTNKPNENVIKFLKKTSRFYYINVLRGSKTYPACNLADVILKSHMIFPGFFFWSSSFWRLSISRMSYFIAFPWHFWYANDTKPRLMNEMSLLSVSTFTVALKVWGRDMR